MVVTALLALVFLNSFVIRLVSFPMYVNFFHFSVDFLNLVLFYYS